MLPFVTEEPLQLLGEALFLGPVVDVAFVGEVGVTGFGVQWVKLVHVAFGPFEKVRGCPVQIHGDGVRAQRAAGGFQVAAQILRAVPGAGFGLKGVDQLGVGGAAGGEFGGEPGLALALAFLPFELVVLLLHAGGDGLEVGEDARNQGLDRAAAGVEPALAVDAVRVAMAGTLEPQSAGPDFLGVAPGARPGVAFLPSRSVFIGGSSRSAKRSSIANSMRCPSTLRLA